MLHPNWWAILKKKGEDDDEDEDEKHRSIEDLGDWSDDDTDWEEHGLGGLEGEEGDFYGEGVEQSEEQERRRLDEDEPAMLDDATTDLIEGSRGHVPSTYDIDELSAETEYFERLGAATREDGINNAVHDLLRSIFILGSEFDSVYLDQPDSEEVEESDENIPHPHRAPFLLPRMMGFGPRVRSEHEVGARPKVRRVNPQAALWELLKKRNQIYEIDPVTRQHVEMDETNPNYPKADDFDIDEHKARIAELEGQASDALYNITTRLGCPERYLIDQLTEMLTRHFLDPEVRGGLGFTVSEDYNEDDHMNRLHGLDTQRRESTDDAVKKRLGAEIDELHRLGREAAGQKLAAQAKHRGKLVKALNEIWKEFTNNVVEPLMKSRDVGEISGRRSLFREIMDSGNLVNPMGDLDGDGRGLGYVSYHHEMFNPEHKKENGPLSINKLIETRGGSLTELAMDLGQPEMLESHAAHGLMAIFGEASGQSPEERERRRGQNEAIFREDVSDWLAGVKHNSSMVSEILAANHLSGDINCQECNHGDPTPHLMDTGWFRLAHPRYDLRKVREKPARRTMTPGQLDSIYGHRGARMNVQELKNRHREVDRELKRLNELADDASEDEFARLIQEKEQLARAITHDEDITYHLPEDSNMESLREAYRQTHTLDALKDHYKISTERPEDVEVTEKERESDFTGSRPRVRHAIGVEREVMSQFVKPRRDGNPLWTEQHEIHHGEHFAKKIAVLQEKMRWVELALEGPWNADNTGVSLAPGFVEFFEMTPDIAKRVKIMSEALDSGRKLGALAHRVSMKKEDLREYLESDNSPLHLQRYALGCGEVLGSLASPTRPGAWLSPLDDARKQNLPFDLRTGQEGREETAMVEDPDGETQPILNEEGHHTGKMTKRKYKKVRISSKLSGGWGGIGFSPLPWAGPMYRDRDLVTGIERKMFTNRGMQQTYIMPDGTTHSRPHWTQKSKENPMYKFKTKVVDTISGAKVKRWELTSMTLNSAILAKIREGVDSHIETTTRYMENSEGQPTAESIGFNLPYQFPLLTPFLRYGPPDAIDASNHLTEEQKEMAKNLMKHVMSGGDIAQLLYGTDGLYLDQCSLCKASGTYRGKPCEQCGGRGSIDSDRVWSHPNILRDASTAAYIALTQDLEGAKELFERQETWPGSGDYVDNWLTYGRRDGRRGQDWIKRKHLIQDIMEDVADYANSKDNWLHRVHATFGVSFDDDGSMRMAIKPQTWQNPQGLNAMCTTCINKGTLSYRDALTWAQGRGHIDWGADDTTAGQQLIELLTFSGGAETPEEQFAKEAVLRGESSRNYSPLRLRWECPDCNATGGCGGCAGEGMEKMHPEVREKNRANMESMGEYVFLEAVREAYPDVEYPLQPGQSVQSFFETNPSIDPTLLGDPTKYQPRDVEESGSGYRNFVGEPFEAIQNSIELQKGREEKNRNSVIADSADSQSVLGPDETGRLRERTPEQDKKVKADLKVLTSTLTGFSDEVKAIRKEYGYDETKYSEDVRDRYQTLLKLMPAMVKRLWSYRGDPLIGAFLSQSMSYGGTRPMWADHLLGDEDFTTEHIKETEKRAKGELGLSLKELMSRDIDWSREHHVWADWRTPHPVDNPLWVEMEELESRMNSPEQWEWNEGKGMSELVLNPLDDRELERLEQLTDKIDREEIERFDWAAHDAKTDKLLKIIQNSDETAEKRQNAEYEFRKHQPYSRAKITLGTGKSMMRILLRFPLYANFPLSEVDGGMHLGMEGEKGMGGMGFQPKPPYTEKEFGEVLEQYDELDILKDRFEQMLSPMMMLAKKMEDAGYGHTLQTLLTGLSEDSEGARKQLEELMEGFDVRTEQGNRASSHDFLSEYPVAHTITPFGPTQEWLMEEKRLRGAMKGGGEEQLEAQEAYQALLDMIPDSPTGRDEEAMREYQAKMVELIESGVMERKGGGMAYGKAFPTLGRTYGNDLLTEYGWHFEDEVKSPGVMYKREDKKNKRFPEGRRTKAHEKFYLHASPLDLNGEHPSLGPYLAFAFLHGGGRGFSIPDRTVVDDDGSLRVGTLDYAPRPQSELEHIMRGVHSRARRMWEYMAVWKPSQLLRILRRGVTGHSNSEVARMGRVILDAHPYFDLNAPNTSDSGYYSQTAVQSEADMEIIKRAHKMEAEKLEKAQQEIVDSKKNFDEIDSKRPSDDAIEEDWERWQDDYQKADKRIQNAKYSLKESNKVTDRLANIVGANLPIEVLIPEYWPHTPGAVDEIDPTLGFTDEQFVTPPWLPGIYLPGYSDDDEYVGDIRARHLETLIDRLSEMRESGISDLEEDEQLEAWVNLHMERGLDEETARRLVNEDSVSLIHYARMNGPIHGLDMAALTEILVPPTECPECEKERPDRVGVVWDSERLVHRDCEQCNGTGRFTPPRGSPHFTVEPHSTFPDMIRPPYGGRRVGYIPEDDCPCEWCVNERAMGPALGVWEKIGASGMPSFSLYREEGEEDPTDEEPVVWNPIDEMLSHRMPNMPLFMDNSDSGVAYREQIRQAMRSDEGPLTALDIDLAGVPERVREMADEFGEPVLETHISEQRPDLVESQVPRNPNQPQIDENRAKLDELSRVVEEEKSLQTSRMPWDPNAPITQPVRDEGGEEIGREPYDPTEGLVYHEGKDQWVEPEDVDEQGNYIGKSEEPIEIAWDALLKNIGLL